MNEIHIAPNRPVYCALTDPEGEYDFELECARYQTTSGQSLTLPRPAVIALNALGVKPGEEIQIIQQWSGRQSDPRRWVIAFSTRTEKNRAAQEATPGPPAAVTPPEAPRPIVAPPTPIRKPSKRDTQPQLFDSRQHQPTCNANLIHGEPCNCIGGPRLFDGFPDIRPGTGTYGPAPTEAPAPRRWTQHAPPVPQIPANVAVREILAFIGTDPNTRNWSDQARQDLASTILIAAYKAGHIGLWERDK